MLSRFIYACAATAALAFAGAPPVPVAEMSGTTTIEARMELRQTGEPARVHNPDCAEGATTVSAADLVLRLSAAAIDAYAGYPVASPLLERADSGQVNWLKVRLGIHDGPAHCATQCIVVPEPAYRRSREEVCMSESGGDGLDCHSGNADYPWGWMGNITASPSGSGNSTVVCAFAKNWSHNRNRWFILRSTY